MQGRNSFALGRMIFFLLSLLTALFLSAGCQAVTSGTSEKPEQTGLHITMLDVGQGDAILIQTPKQNILIDTGDTEAHDKLRTALKKAGVRTIDKLIITHPHADHIGGASMVMSDFTVKEVYDNGQATTTKLYRSYLQDIKQHDIAYHVLRAGDQLDFGDGASFRVFNPTAQPAVGGLNGGSVVGRLSYGGFSMLFTGDCEAEQEKRMLREYGNDLHSQILKSPHHGSHTSSSARWLEAIAPEVILISAGQGNDYGHPHKEVLARYEKIGAKVYRTDLQGAIMLFTDGQSYCVEGAR